MFLMVGTISSCNYNPLDVDASDVDVSILYQNVDSVIAYSDSSSLLKHHHQYKNEIPGIYGYLTGYCLQIGSVSDTAFYNSIKMYRADEGIIELNAQVKNSYSKITGYNQEITSGFQHLKYHLADCKLPSNVAYINSLFASSIYCSEDGIAIGLERYLGEENEVIKKLNPMEFHEWIKHGMDESYLTRDVLTGWIETHLIAEANETISEQMIRWGKILYLTEAAFPEKSQATVLRYKEDELKWAEENTFSFWQYLIDQNLLYSTDQRLIANLLNPGPTTTGLPTEGAPDRLGRFLGWKMVHQYVEFNELKVKDIIDADYKEILLNFEVED